MTTTTQNEIRSKYLDVIKAAFTDEEVGMIASNTINFPIVTADGEEAWIEVTVKIPKEDDGYDKRTEYEIKSAERKQKAEEAAAKKAKKIAEAKAKKETKEKKESEGT